MDNSNVFVRGANQVNEEKPLPRVCPRCNSDNTKFCYYNNYSLSQPRYICKNCRRYWTHGGALRNIPIGGSGRKTKRQKIDQPSLSQMVSVEIQQINHHQPFLHVQETNEFVGSFGGSSSVVAVGNHFGSFSEIHGDMVLPIRTIRPLMDRLDFSDGSFNQDYFDVGSNDLGNSFINQPIGRHVDSYSGYRMNQEDQNKQNQSFNNTLNMNHNTSTNESRGSSGIDHMNKNNNNKVIKKCVFRSSSSLEKNGP
ncbi:hypothetical protein EUTSA_v10026815mg [Eutrema salsugineum]|uniref:Dof zinc finger protein n=1 Tax=Eutrema salsugineum TaxID=72664 RepID=V4LX81_EUTSA|nr:dof zinc finger protein DOF4.4 [Eutrema salsugineum]ESQ55285.1 hypothetical protein EUTSA_v10026815mg [Eutrema salsugineum]